MSKGRNFTLKTPFKSGSSKLQRGPQTIKIPSFFSGTSIAMLGSSQIWFLKAQKKSNKRILELWIRWRKLPICDFCSSLHRLQITWGWRKQKDHNSKYCRDRATIQLPYLSHHIETKKSSTTLTRNMTCMATTKTDWIPNTCSTFFASVFLDLRTWVEERCKVWERRQRAKSWCQQPSAKHHTERERASSWYQTFQTSE